MMFNNRTKWTRIVGVAMLVTMLASPVMADQNKAESRQGMGDMQSMDQVMAECQKHNATASQMIDQLMLMMEKGKRANDPAKMRDVLEKSQTDLAALKRDMAPCMNMMNMMQNMSGSMGGQMGGMMQGGSGGPMQGMMSEKHDQKTGQKAGSMMGGRGMGEMESCWMCTAEMVLIGVLLLSAIAALIALTIFLIRRSRLGGVVTSTTLNKGE